jgi:hypothetical protein
MKKENRLPKKGGEEDEGEAKEEQKVDEDN